MENLKNSEIKKIKLHNGKEISYIDKLSALESYHEIYDEKEYFQFGLEITDNAIVFDIGANIGNFSRYVAENNPNSKIYSFEPVPQIFEVLKFNTNDYSDKINIYNYGLGNKEEETNIDFFPRLSADSSIIPYVWKDKIEFYSKNWHKFTQENIFSFIVPKFLRPFFVNLILKFIYKPLKVKCKIKTLSSIIKENKISRIDFLKIDAENYEDFVIAGIEENHWAIIKQISLEVHQHIEGGENLISKFRDLFISKGFTVSLGNEFMAPGSNVFMLYAKK